MVRNHLVLRENQRERDCLDLLNTLQCFLITHLLLREEAAATGSLPLHKYYVAFNKLSFKLAAEQNT